MSQTPVVAPVVAPYPARRTKPWDLPLKAYIDSVVAYQAFYGGPALSAHVEASTDVHGIDDTGSLVHRQTGNKVNMGRGANYYDSADVLRGILSVQDRSVPFDPDDPLDSYDPILQITRPPLTLDPDHPELDDRWRPLLVLRGVEDAYWGGDAPGDLFQVNRSDGLTLFGVGAENGVYMGASAFATYFQTDVLNVNTVETYGVVKHYAETSFVSNGRITSWDPSYVGVIVRGKPSQTADLIQGQNSSGSALAAITATGAFRVGATAAMGKHATADAPQFNTQVFAAGAFRSDAGFNPNTGTNGFALTNEGLGILNFGAKMKIANNATDTAFTFSVNNAQGTPVLAEFYASGPGLTPIVATGVPGQTADLLRVRAHDRVHVRVAADGVVTFNETSGSVIMRDLALTGTLATAALLSRSANVNLALDSLSTASGVTIGKGNDTTAIGNALTVFPKQFNFVGSVVRGLASQSGDLAQWQNSSAGVLAGVTSGGNIFTNTGGSTLSMTGTNFIANRVAGYYIENRGTYGPIVFKSSNLAAGDTEVFRATVNGVVINDAINLTPNSIPLVVRGSALQSGDLTQWRDSAGATLSRLTPSGEFEQMTAGAGYLFKAPNGTRYRVAVSNAGALTTTAI